MGPEEIIKTLLGTTPLAAVLFYMWYLERAGRIEERKENRVLTERAIKGLEDVATALRDLNNKLPGPHG